MSELNLTPPISPRQTVVLSAGRDATVLDTRNRVLRSAGYVVTAACSTVDIVERFFDGDFDLIVLCHSIPPMERDRILGLAHRHSPSTPVIVVSGYATDLAIKGAEMVSTDPVQLVSAVMQVITRAHRPRALASSASQKRQSIA